MAELGGDVLKQYLVKVGFVEDKKTLKELIGGIKNLNFSLTALAKSAIEVSKKFISLDQSMERTARNMMTSKENAYALTQAYKTMFGESFSGLTDILQMTNTEYREFIELQKAYKSVGVPKDYVETLQKGRELLLEVNKLKVMFQSGLRRAAYILIKGFDGPLSRIKGYIQNFKENLPTLMDKIGKTLIIIVDRVSRLAEAGFKIIDFINNKLPESLKRFLAISAVIGVALLANPFGKALFAIAAVLMLIDDYLTWKRGGITAIGDTWAGIESIFTMGKSGQGTFLDSFSQTLEVSRGLLKDILTIIIDIMKSGFGEYILDSLDFSFRSLLSIISGVVYYLYLIKGWVEGNGFRKTIDEAHNFLVDTNKKIWAGFDFDPSEEGVMYYPGYYNELEDSRNRGAGRIFENTVSLSVNNEITQDGVNTTIHRGGARVYSGYNDSHYVLNDVTINRMY